MSKLSKQTHFETWSTDEFKSWREKKPNETKKSKTTQNKPNHTKTHNPRNTTCCSSNLSATLSLCAAVQSVLPLLWHSSALCLSEAALSLSPTFHGSPFHGSPPCRSAYSHFPRMPSSKRQENQHLLQASGYWSFYQFVPFFTEKERQEHAIL